MAGLYDVEIDLSSNDGGLPRDSFKDGMRVRLFGNSVQRKVSIPPLTGAVIFKNDGGDDVTLRRGGAIPVTVGRGSAIMVLFDGTASGMTKVE